MFSFQEITRLSVNVVKNGEYFLNCFKNSTLTDTIYNTEVHIFGSKRTLHRYNLTKDDFTLYEFNVANPIGNATFRIQIAAAVKNITYICLLNLTNI